MSLNKTPKANRLHIGIFGKMNSGKSTLLNALTNQESALVSEYAGTTSDPVYKAMEIKGIGPVVWIDTAGYDDLGEIGEKRICKSREAIDKCDMALLILKEEVTEYDKKWYHLLKERDIPIIIIENQEENSSELDLSYFEETKIIVNALKKIGMLEIQEAILKKVPTDYDSVTICANLVKENDLVVLVMPQDKQAPKGRLILPQVQTIRELLDRNVMIASCTLHTFENTLKSLSKQPNLIICDSQIFKEVYEWKPAQVPLTSFSVLFANYKGDLNSFIEGAKAISKLNDTSHVLIAEACTHAPISEDIGRVKIPMMLRKSYGNMKIDIVSGNDFPKDLSMYDLIIHCGACMFHRKYVLHRIYEAKKQKIPITNYGICIAYLKGILEYIKLPEHK